MEVYRYGDDAFYNRGVHDIVRFRESFTKNINKQKYEIMKWPTLQGRLVKLNQNDIKLNESVSVILSKINRNNLRCLEN